MLSDALKYFPSGDNGGAIRLSRNPTTKLPYLLQAAPPSFLRDFQEGPHQSLQPPVGFGCAERGIPGYPAQGLGELNASAKLAWP